MKKYFSGIDIKNISKFPNKIKKPSKGYIYYYKKHKHNLCIFLDEYLLDIFKGKKTYILMFIVMYYMHQHYNKGLIPLWSLDLAYLYIFVKIGEKISRGNYVDR